MAESGSKWTVKNIRKRSWRLLVELSADVWMRRAA
jgi:hypothetical protein